MGRSLSITARIDKSTVNVWWRGWGHPDLRSEPGFQLVFPRTSINIWHQPDVNIWCKNGKGFRHSMTYVGSAFPSRRLWIDGVLKENEKQKAFVDLWIPWLKDLTWVAP
jgi:hypothetical protein